MYIVPGSSDDFDPDPYWSWLASGSRRFGDHLRVGGAISGATAPFSGASDTLEAKVRVNWWASERTAVGGYLARGLDDGSPDWGAGVSVAVDF
ncbi:MAG: hypothetical protein IH614_07280 [Desulfuromonadales bacterium]|nr:hypothetical protein [Desulfuromonadales bacterium]